MRVRINFYKDKMFYLFFEQHGTNTLAVYLFIFP